MIKLFFSLSSILCARALIKHFDNLYARRKDSFSQENLEDNSIDMVQDCKQEEENPITVPKKEYYTRNFINPHMRYFAVDAKVGHVGKNKYMIKTFIIYAEDGRAAAEFVRNSPRVKHNHKDAIRNVTEISLQEYTERRKAMYEDPYFNVTTIQEQRAANIDIENAFEEEAEVSFKNHKHSLRKTFHEDERYFTYRNYHGKINSEDIA